MPLSTIFSVLASSAVDLAWVLARIGLNQRLYNWYVLPLRYKVRSTKE